jgi:hypothetical protein
MRALLSTIVSVASALAVVVAFAFVLLGCHPRRGSASAVCRCRCSCFALAFLACHPSPKAEDLLLSLLLLVIPQGPASVIAAGTVFAVASRYAKASALASPPTVGKGLQPWGMLSYPNQDRQGSHTRTRRDIIIPHKVAKIRKQHPSTNHHYHAFHHNLTTKTPCFTANFPQNASQKNLKKLNHE